MVIIDKKKYSSDRRFRLKKEGKCVDCGRSKVVVDKTKCKVCLDKSKEKSKRYQDIKRSKGLCNTCGKNKIVEGQNTRCRGCIDSRKVQEEKERIYRTERGMCIVCGKVCVSKLDGLTCIECKSIRNKRGCESRMRLKIKTINAYGGKCFCCGEGNIYFLSIDHINGDGAEHRRVLGSSGGVHFYKWLKNKGFPKKDYRLLCHNCNLGRYLNGGVCPHVYIKRLGGRD